MVATLFYFVITAPNDNGHVFLIFVNPFTLSDYICNKIYSIPVLEALPLYLIIWKVFMLMFRGSVSKKENIIQMAWIMSLVQFVNALEAMMINPLFPFMAHHYSVPIMASGYVASSYTLAALVSGCIAYYKVNTWNKKNVILFNLFLLTSVTFLTPFMTNIKNLIILRLLAGLCGGMTLSIGLSLLINKTMPEQRGKVIAIVISSFSFISIAGLPLILWIAEKGKWPFAFWFVAAACAIAFVLTWIGISNDNTNISSQQKLNLNRVMFIISGANGIAQFSTFIIMPILVPVFVHYMNVQLSTIPWLFFAGGIASLIGSHVTGYLVKRYNELVVVNITTLLFILNLFLLAINCINNFIFMFLFMSTSYSRIIATSTFSAHFSTNELRGKFNALQNIFSNLLSSIAFFLPSIILQGSDVKMDGTKIIIASVVTAVILPFYLYFFKKKHIYS